MNTKYMAKIIIIITTTCAKIITSDPKIFSKFNMRIFYPVDLLHVI